MAEAAVIARMKRRSCEQIDYNHDHAANEPEVVDTLEALSDEDGDSGSGRRRHKLMGDHYRYTRSHRQTLLEQKFSLYEVRQPGVVVLLLMHVDDISYGLESEAVGRCYSWLKGI